MIERVEVIRGPGSALYGNNAFVAVVNVITRTAGDVKGFEASGVTGSLNTYKGRLTYGKVFESGLSLMLTGTLFDSGGNDRLYYKEFNDRATNRGLAEGLDADSFESAGVTMNYQDFTFQGGFVSRLKDVPTASYGTIFNHSHFYTLDERSFFRLGYAHEFEHDLSVRASVFRNSYNYSGDYPFAADPARPYSATINRDTVDAQWWGVELQVSKQVFNTHHLTFGMESQDNSKLLMANYDVSPHVDNLKLGASSSILGMYLQDEWAITRRLTLNAGLRYDLYETFGSTFNPRTAFIWHPLDKTTLKLLYGQAYRAPNTYEFSYANSFFRLNPDLQPETVRSHELVVEQVLTPAVRLSASGFYNRIDDLISEKYDTAANQSFFENNGLAETKGASVEIEAKLPKGIKGRVSYTLQRTTDAVTGERFSNSPEHLAKFNLMFPLVRDKVFSGFELQYSSATQNLAHQATGSYVLANWTIFSAELAKGLDVSASVYNLFDRKYGYPGGPEHLQESIPQDGRTLRVKLTYHF